jgi:hypothetical protein
VVELRRKGGESPDGVLLPEVDLPRLAGAAEGDGWGGSKECWRLSCCIHISINDINSDITCEKRQSALFHVTATSKSGMKMRKLRGPYLYFLHSFRQLSLLLCVLRRQQMILIILTICILKFSRFVRCDAILIIALHSIETVIFRRIPWIIAVSKFSKSQSSTRFERFQVCKICLNRSSFSSCCCGLAWFVGFEDTHLLELLYQLLAMGGLNHKALDLLSPRYRNVNTA